MARKLLTALRIEKLRPNREKRLEVPDHQYPQLRLIIQPTGARSWAVRSRIGDKTVKITLKRGLDLKGAREAARKILEQIDQGIDPRVAERQSNSGTLGGIVELYLKATSGEVRAKTRIERERHLRRDWKPLHDRPLAEIKKRDVAARLLEIKDQHGAIAANRSRTSLHNLCEWAIDQDLIEANVAAATRRPLLKEPRRTRVLTPDERREIWAATAGDGFYDRIVRLLLLILQRREEVGGMRRSELDLESAMWSLPPERTKNALTHLVPLPRQAVEILERQLEAQRSAAEADRECKERDYIFGEGEGPYSGWSRSKRRLDRRILEARRKALAERGEDLDQAEPMPHWTLHDLRRTGVTAMNDELGVAPHVVEAAINHVSGEAKRGVAGTYNRALYLEERTRALQAWADHLTAAPAAKVISYRPRWRQGDELPAYPAQQ
jgi:integrase